MVPLDVRNSSARAPRTLAERVSPGARRSCAGLERDVRPAAERLGARARARLRAILAADVESEFDARFLRARLAGRAPALGPAIRRALERWADDEERHYRAFRAVLEHGLGHAAAFFEALAGRCPDFGPIEHLLADELAVACLLAYDELATVRAFRANLPWYDRLGPRFGAFVRGVIADEAWHYALFLDVLRREHAHRAAEVPRIVARIRAAEGTPYAATFVLDHDDAVFTEAIQDEAARILVEHAARPVRSA